MSLQRIRERTYKEQQKNIDQSLTTFSTWVLAKLDTKANPRYLNFPLQREDCCQSCWGSSSEGTSRAFSSWLLPFVHGATVQNGFLSSDHLVPTGEVRLQFTSRIKSFAWRIWPLPPRWCVGSGCFGIPLECIGNTRAILIGGHSHSCTFVEQCTTLYTSFLRWSSSVSSTSCAAFTFYSRLVRSYVFVLVTPACPVCTWFPFQPLRSVSKGSSLALSFLVTQGTNRLFGLDIVDGLTSLRTCWSRNCLSCLIQPN